jgi:quercetin dioxygenase-like cupin family protein
MSVIEINAGQLGIRYLVDGSRTASLGMFELTVPPASNVPPPHSHSNNEEIVYVLEGTLRYAVGSDTRDLSPGQTPELSPNPDAPSAGLRRYRLCQRTRAGAPVTSVR